MREVYIEALTFLAGGPTIDTATHASKVEETSIPLPRPPLHMPPPPGFPIFSTEEPVFDTQPLIDPVIEALTRYAEYAVEPPKKIEGVELDLLRSEDLPFAGVITIFDRSSEE